MDSSVQIEQNMMLRWELEEFGIDTEEEEEEEEDDEEADYEDNILSDSADSGISLSSLSCDSETGQYEEHCPPDSGFVNTVAGIVRDLVCQLPSYTGALMDFTAAGLASSEPYVRRSAAVFAWQLFRACHSPCYDELETKERMLLLLRSGSCDVVAALLRSLELDRDSTTTSSAASSSQQMRYWVSGSLHYISRSGPGCDRLWDSGGISAPALIVALMSDQQPPSVVFYALTTLHNILLARRAPPALAPSMAGAAARLLTQCYSGGAPYPATSLAKLLAICVDCLALLCGRSDPAKALAAGPDCLGALLGLLNRHPHSDKLVQAGLRLLRTLSSGPVVKPRLALNPAYVKLVARLLTQPAYWPATLWTLRNLSDLLFRRPSACEAGSSTGPMTGQNQETLRRVCSMLGPLATAAAANTTTASSESDMLFQCAAGVLANASCDCPENKEILVKMSVPQVLLRSLARPNYQRWSGETLEALYRCLHHLCSNHPGARHVSVLCLSAPLEVLTNIRDALHLFDAGDLKTSTDTDCDCSEDVPISWSVLRAWLGLVRHLCVHRHEHSQLHSIPQTDCSSVSSPLTTTGGFNAELHGVMHQFLRQLHQQVESKVSNAHRHTFLTNYLSQLQSSLVLVDNLLDLSLSLQQQ